MNAAEHYAYRVVWSATEAAFIGSVAELPALTATAATAEEAFTQIRSLASDAVADLAGRGMPVPVPYADRDYSGRFQVRVPPEMHRRLTIEAAEQSISLNRLVVSRLSSRRPR